VAAIGARCVDIWLSLEEEEVCEKEEEEEEEEEGLAG